MPYCPARILILAVKNIVRLVALVDRFKEGRLRQSLLLNDDECAGWLQFVATVQYKNKRLGTILDIQRIQISWDVDDILQKNKVFEL